MTAPLASLVIRTYNRAENLPQALQCLFEQDWPNKEIIVVDDGSTDDTREVVAQYPDVRYIYQENQGVQGARLTGLRASTGKYLAYLDSDDQWVPHFLRTSIEQIEKHEAGFAFCHFARSNGVTGERYHSGTEETPALKAILDSGESQPHFLPPEEARRLFLFHLPAPTSAFVLRREFFDGRWKGKVFVMDDVFTILEMIFRHKVAGVFLPEQMMTKLCYPSSVCDGGHPRRWELLWHAHDYEVILKNFGPRMSPDERRFYHREIEENSFALGYILSEERDWRGACRQYLTALRNRPSLHKLLALIKLPAKMILSPASRPAQS